VAARFDFVVCEGSDFEGATSAFEFNINAEIARNIDAPVLLVVDGHKIGKHGQMANLDFAVQSFQDGDCKVLAAILNRFPADRIDELPAFLRTARYPDLPVFAIPEDPLLAAPNDVRRSPRLSAPRRSTGPTCSTPSRPVLQRGGFLAVNLPLAAARRRAAVHFGRPLREPAGRDAQAQLRQASTSPASC
jgi:hypothetical protein